MDLRTNRIPKRISPDRLTNAVITFTIEDKYSCSYLETLLVGRYNSRHPDLILDKLRMNGRGSDNEQRYFFANKLFRVAFFRNTIVFNFVTAYPGWNVYREWMSDVLSDDELVFNRVALRFISDYRDIAVFSSEVLDGTISFNHIQNFDGTELHFRCHVHDFDNRADILGDAHVILINCAQYENVDWKESRIDINIVSSSFSEKKETSFSLLEKLHRHEKILFYSMLNEVFVRSLHPEYD